MRARQFWFMAALTLPLAGCSKAVRMSDITHPHFDAPSACRLITPGPRLANLQDRASVEGLKITFPTGQRARQIFTGRQTPWRLEYTRSTLAVDCGDAWPLPVALQTSAQYQIECRLTNGPVSEPLMASGLGAAGIHGESAVADAIDAGLRSLALQSAAVIDARN